jgi:hypothetical protein
MIKLYTSENLRVNDKKRELPGDTPDAKRAQAKKHLIATSFANVIRYNYMYMYYSVCQGDVAECYMNTKP